MRLVIVEELAAILFDINEDEDESPADRELLRDAMLDVADILAETLDLQVESITDGIALVRLNIAGSDVQ